MANENAVLVAVSPQRKVRMACDMSFVIFSLTPRCEGNQCRLEVIQAEAHQPMSIFNKRNDVTLILIVFPMGATVINPATLSIEELLEIPGG